MDCWIKSNNENRSFFQRFIKVFIEKSSKENKNMKKIKEKWDYICFFKIIFLYINKQNM